MTIGGPVVAAGLAVDGAVGGAVGGWVGARVADGPGPIVGDGEGRFGVGVTVTVAADVGVTVAGPLEQPAASSQTSPRKSLECIALSRWRVGVD